MAHLNFLDAGRHLFQENPENKSYLYFPLASETGLKSAVTPNLGGDAKVNRRRFCSSRSVPKTCTTTAARAISGCAVMGKPGPAPAAPRARNRSALPLRRSNAGHGRLFVAHAGTHFPAARGCRPHHPVLPAAGQRGTDGHNGQNTRSQPLQIVPFAAIPLYGRSADNLRDHRNVTSMLHRIRTTAHGVVLKPTMSFDERGHRPNHTLYYVMGFGPDEQQPEAFYPTVESFLGEGGTYLQPGCVLQNLPGVPAGATAAGREAMGAFRFPGAHAAPGETAQYMVMLGVGRRPGRDRAGFCALRHPGACESARWRKNRSVWREKVNVSFHTGREAFDRLMKWVCLQPFLRRLFGCSFLPHHDYGRGGRGWRDLWQDCLSLLLMEPDDVGQMIEKNFGGVRIDGTNATIIGDGDGNFIADRNGIARVWMDHALWPQMTTKLYIDQTATWKS